MNCTRSLLLACSALVACSAAGWAGDNPAIVSVQRLNQNIDQYVGKQVQLNAHIDRYLGNGAYLVSDSNNNNNGSDESHRVLVITTSGTQANAERNRQRAGITAPTIRSGEAIQLTGQVEQMSIANQVENYSPGTREETIQAEQTNLPVIVVRGENLKLEG